MALDEKDIRNGTKFIVGKWRPEYVVSLLSDDLKHIPAAEFKSPEGRDLTALEFEFFEDGSMKASNTEKGVCESGEWELTGPLKFRWTVPEVLGVPEGAFREAVEKLEVADGRLVFSLGILVIALEKTEEGVFTEAPAPCDLEPTEEDAELSGIVGVYGVAKAMSMVGDKFGLFSKEEVEANIEKLLEAGDTDPETAAQMLSGFKMRVEFTPDHKVIMWTPIPKGVTEEQISAALAAGEIKAVKDGFFCGDDKEWKAVQGKYFYNTGEHREIFGEEQSPWDELAPDGEGLIPFSSGMVLLKKLS